ncbi:hypothetical protein BC832DRAFT_244239 [Gaertneriomyces semiglobifer]|nr:hypothetical protein BC832DRAFT_244239 [Gaertneriomyces semiglobifer]
MSQSPGAASTTATSTIPASRRADGTLRKERKVRPGYVPPEDVKRYTNAKVESMKLPEGYVPGLGVVEKKEGAAGSKSAKKNAKRKEKKTTADAGSGQTPVKPVVEEEQLRNGKPTETAPSGQQPDNEKRLKNLRKKLRQIDDIQAKLDKGNELLPEQREKLQSRSDVEKEIHEIEELVAKLTV